MVDVHRKYKFLVHPVGAIPGWWTATRDSLAGMPSKHGHPVRSLRGMDEEDWQTFGEQTEGQELDRSAVLRQFIRWYIAKPGASLPQRPSDNP